MEKKIEKRRNEGMMECQVLVKGQGHKRVLNSEERNLCTHINSTSPNYFYRTYSQQFKFST